MEAKFWAGLTDSQPVEYLRRIKDQGSGTLAFIVPAQRTELVWNEILRRCSSAAIKVTDRSAAGSWSRFADFGAGRSICLITWNSFIENLSSELKHAGEQALASDLAQLRGLCEREDAKAFLPLMSEELTGTTAQRLIQFGELVDDITNHLVKTRVADIKGFKSGGGNGWYGRSMRIHGCGCTLLFNAWNWRDHNATPLWFTVRGPQWKPTPQLTERILQRAKAKNIPTVSTNEGIDMPIFLRTRVEREEVFRTILDQLGVVIEWLRELKLRTRLDRAEK